VSDGSTPCKLTVVDAGEPITPSCDTVITIPKLQGDGLQRMSLPPTLTAPVAELIVNLPASGHRWNKSQQKLESAESPPRSGFRDCGSQTPFLRGTEDRARLLDHRDQRLGPGLPA
jgi:hypothetical protein